MYLLFVYRSGRAIWQDARIDSFLLAPSDWLGTSAQWGLRELGAQARPGLVTPTLLSSRTLNRNRRTHRAVDGYPCTANSSPVVVIQLALTSKRNARLDQTAHRVPRSAEPSVTSELGYHSVSVPWSSILASTPRAPPPYPSLQ